MPSLLRLATPVLFACWLLSGLSFAMSEQEARDVARLLALFLDSGRVVLAEHQQQINDPNKGEKGLTAPVFESQLIEEFRHRSGGVDLRQSDQRALSAQGLALLNGLVQAGTEVMHERQTIINERFLGYKNVIPATWGTWTSEKFSLAA